MFLQAALLMFHSCLGLCGAAAQHMELERIKTCGIKCSQDLQCNTKPAYFFADSCQMPADGLTVSSVFRNLSFSTVMTCEGHQRCSLHLGIHTTVQLPDTRNAAEVPNSQDVKGFQADDVRDADCSWKDLRRLVPECITGSLSYDINAERKELRVTVSDMLDDEDYQLRLCHKDFICAGTGANALIMKEEVNKSAILPYFRPLPCLCIEVKPSGTQFPHRESPLKGSLIPAGLVCGDGCSQSAGLEEMWHGIHFDTSAGVLSWEPACPVTATVALCQRGGEDGVCTDLQQASQNVSRGKITFAQVDPHPQLCMKFRAGHQSWIRCPFVGRFQAWDVTVMRHADHKEAKLTSHMNATFSVHACAPSEGPAVCRATGTHAVIYVGAHASVGLNVTDTHSCFYVRRTDVTYAPTILHCLTEERSEPAALFATPANQMLIAVIVPVGLWLTAVIIVTLVLHVRLTDSAPVCDVSQHRDRRSAL
ncbi:interleukin-17 receptor E isoform X3 [Dunckerocampus dactyliophorus]|uniref:interleukin-17 receptor E isoform X3 n=1 Tax=Dunckerocampus dactyliophorus TaxID=161453 RepID=UPI002404D544|nr:interleukin-17 receptor E isoform X3 [Dunckerocampus dactyliophorus]